MVDQDFRRLVAKVKAKDFIEKKVAFAIVDISNGRDIFAQVHICMDFL